MESFEKATQIFFTNEDEERYSREIVRLRPSVVFVDDNVWPSPHPVERALLSDCQSRFVFVWDKAMIPVLPRMQRKDGQFEGPVSGVVVQIIRSRISDSELSSGRLAAGADAESATYDEMKRLSDDAWTALSKVSTRGVVPIDPQTKKEIGSNVSEYYVGKSAQEWISADAGRLFKDNGTSNYFLPALSHSPKRGTR